MTARPHCLQREDCKATDAADVDAPIALPPIAPIAQRVADYHGLTLSNLRNASRARRYARPRQIAYLLAREQTRRSYTQIGQFFRRDHGTVHYGVHAIRALAERDARLRADLDALRAGAAA